MSGRKILIGMVVACAVLTVGMLIFGLSQMADEWPPYNDAHLKLPPIKRTLADRDNAYEVLLSLEKVLVKKNDAERDKMHGMLAANATWDSAFAERMIRRNRPALDLLDKAMRSPGFEYPDDLYPETIEDLDRFYPVRFEVYNDVVILRRLEIRKWFLEGDEQRALRAVQELLKLSDWFEKGTMMGLAFANVFRQYAYEDLFLILRDSTMPVSEWQKLQGRLKPDPKKYAAVIEDLLKREYWNSLLMVQGAVKVVESGFDEKAQEEFGEDGGKLASALGKMPLTMYAYHPNRTRHQLATWYEERISLVDAPLSLIELDEAREDNKPWNTDTASGMLMPNMAGRLILSLVVPRYGNYTILYPRRWVAYDRLLTVRIALRGYQNDHDGKLPESLDALSPAYLENIPADPFYERPLGYDAKRRILYVLGSDADIDPLATRTALDPKVLVWPIVVKL